MQGNESERQEAGTRALVLAAPPQPGATAGGVRPRATFLAHLIATARRLPQTRERRRGSAGEAVAVYAAPAGADPARPRTALSRCV